GWSYSNFGYALLGLILEEAAGQDQWEVIRSRILEPLDLADTFFDSELRTPPGLARGYADLYGDGSLTDTSDWDALHPLDAEGGIVSTVYDVHRFLDALFNGNLLTAPSLAEMLTCVEESPGEVGNTYGLGIANSTIDGKPAYNHTGWVTGYLSAFCIFPEQQATVVLLINGSSGAPEAEFIKLVTERLPPLLE
ncbi:MAG: class A beta-lactamase-related serine hydrolase, partial [Spirochaetales bacterium]